jgi:hypothetical protein
MGAYDEITEAFCPVCCKFYNGMDIKKSRRRHAILILCPESHIIKEYKV